MQKIAPFLWFDGKAEEAASFCVSIFKNSRIGEVMRYGEGAPAPKGSVMAVNFQIEGQDFIALNGGPVFQFTPAISFFVKCTTQADVDELWDKLSAGGTKQHYAWLQDKFGTSWQIVPTILGELLQHKDPEKAKKVM